MIAITRISRRPVVRRCVCCLARIRPYQDVWGLCRKCCWVMVGNMVQGSPAWPVVNQYFKEHCDEVRRDLGGNKAGGA